MVRASELNKICTHRPDKIDLSGLKLKWSELYHKVSSKEPYDNSKDYTTVRGVSGLAKEIQKIISKVKPDELPEGAKEYLKLRWLENYGFKKNYISNMAVWKGNIMEDEAIDLLSSYLNIPFSKYDEHIMESNFLRGVCDVHYKDTVRDIKVPETWESFRKKEITDIYKFQLLAYHILYGATELYLDYILMPTPMEFYEINENKPKVLEIYEINDALILSMDIHSRIKSFKIEIDEEEIKFIKSRLKMAELFYNQLNLEKCM